MLPSFSFPSAPPSFSSPPPGGGPSALLQLPTGPPVVGCRGAQPMPPPFGFGLHRWQLFGARFRPFHCPAGFSFASIVIDGSNVGHFRHGRRVFCSSDVMAAVSFFRQAGAMDIKVVVPDWVVMDASGTLNTTGCSSTFRPAQITEKEVLRKLHQAKVVVSFPQMNRFEGKTNPYDDHCIVEIAYESDGCIISSDRFRDVAANYAKYRTFLETRRLSFGFEPLDGAPPSRMGASGADFSTGTVGGASSSSSGSGRRHSKFTTTTTVTTKTSTKTRSNNDGVASAEHFYLMAPGGRNLELKHLPVFKENLYI